MSPCLAKIRPRRRSLPILFLVLAAGCARTTATTAQDPRPVQSAPTPDVIPLTVALYLDDDFRQYTYRERNFRIPLGEWLSQKAPISLGPLFRAIQVVPDRSHLDAAAGKYEAVLRPRIHFASYHPFFRKRRTLLEPQGRIRIYTEWTLSDPSGRKIWIQEIVGLGEGDDKSRSRLEAAVEAAMADLFKKLHIALTTSTQVYNYAYGTP